MNDHTTSATKYNAPDFPPGGREVLTCMAFIDAQPRTKKMHRISGLMKDVIRSWSGCFSIQSEHMHEAAQRLQVSMAIRSDPPVVISFDPPVIVS